MKYLFQIYFTASFICVYNKSSDATTAFFGRRLCVKNYVKIDLGNL